MQTTEQQLRENFTNAANSLNEKIKQFEQGIEAGLKAEYDACLKTCNDAIAKVKSRGSEATKDMLTQIQVKAKNKQRELKNRVGDVKLSFQKTIDEKLSDIKRQLNEAQSEVMDKFYRAILDHKKQHQNRRHELLIALVDAQSNVTSKANKLNQLLERIEEESNYSLECMKRLSVRAEQQIQLRKESDGIESTHEAEMKQLKDQIGELVETMHSTERSLVESSLSVEGLDEVCVKFDNIRETLLEQYKKWGSGFSHSTLELPELNIEDSSFSLPDQKNCTNFKQFLDKAVNEGASHLEETRLQQVARIASANLELEEARGKLNALVSCLYPLLQDVIFLPGIYRCILSLQCDAAVKHNFTPEQVVEYV